MDFNSNRENLLKQLKTQQKDKKRQEANHRAKMRLAEKNISSSSNTQKDDTEVSKKPKVLLYGVVRIFLGTIKSILNSYCEVYEFNDAEKATDFIFENHIPIVILDMDPPNDWKMCHDLFTTGKTMYPDIEYFVYQKEKSIADEIKILEAQGAKIMNKPIDQMELIGEIKKIANKGKKSE